MPVSDVEKLVVFFKFLSEMLINVELTLFKPVSLHLEEDATENLSGSIDLLS